MSLGERIRDLRLDKGLSGKELAELASVSQSSISRIELNQQSPTIETLKNICAALEIQLIDILVDELVPSLPSQSKNQMKLSPTNIGERIKGLRRSLGWTGKELGDKSGVSQSFISMIEKGINSPTVETLEKLLAAMGVSLHNFFYSEKNQTSPQLLNIISQLDEEDKELLHYFLKNFQGVRKRKDYRKQNKN